VANKLAAPLESQSRRGHFSLGRHCSCQCQSQGRRRSSRRQRSQLARPL